MSCRQLPLPKPGLSKNGLTSRDNEPAIPTGCRDEVSRLKEVLVCRPIERALGRGGSDPFRYGYRTRLDAARAITEWEAFEDLLSDCGVRVHRIQTPEDGLLLGGENLHYPRDLAQVIGDKCYVAAPLTPEREAEAEFFAHVPELGGTELVRCSPVVEFGDVILGEGGVVIVGYGPRTSSEGFLALRKLLGSAGWEQMIAIDMRPLGSDVRYAHLDLSFNVLGGRRALVFTNLLGLPAELWSGHRRRSGSFAELLAAAQYVVLEVSPRMQFAGATNVLNIDHDHVVATQAALEIGLRDMLAKLDIRVSGIAAAEILKTGGGPRCLSMPRVRG